ncbi:hypothetical protein AADZ91_18080 [Colwelliaceae bacterium 6441]
MSYEKAYKISLIFFIAIILMAVVVTPQVEGYGDSVANIAILALSGHWLIHNVIALKYGQIDIKGFPISRKEKPKAFILVLILKSIFAILFSYLVLR